MRPEIILAFDTSAAHCAAAVLSGRMNTWVEMMAKGQAERLVPILEELLSIGEVSWSDIDLIVVGTGPGNFTGIRIAVALARGLALGLGIPAIGVTGFEAGADAAGGERTVAIPAPRGQVYLKVPGEAARIVDAVPKGSVWLPDMPLEDLVSSMAFVGQEKAATVQPRPAPFYLRGADAAPASDPPPVILP